MPEAATPSPAWCPDLVDRLRRGGIPEQDALLTAEMASDVGEFGDLLARMERLEVGSSAKFWALVGS